MDNVDGKEWCDDNSSLDESEQWVRQTAKRLGVTLTLPHSGSESTGITEAMQQHQLKMPNASLNSETHEVKLAARAASAGWQPKVSRLPPLIEDGLHDELKHVEVALKLSHPGYADVQFPADLADSMMWLKEHGRAANYHRLHKLYQLEMKAKEFAAESAKLRSTASETSSKCLPNLDVLLMEYVGREVDIEDTAVPRTLLLGFPIAGETPDSPFFYEKHEEASCSVEEFLKTTEARRTSIAASMEMNETVNVKPEVPAAHAENGEEVSSGSMSGPYSAGEILSKHDRYFNVTRRFSS